MTDERHSQPSAGAQQMKFAAALTEWADLFDQLAGRIDGFVAGSEASFTGFGGRLQRGMLRAGEVAGAATEAVGLLSGDDFDRALVRIAAEVQELDGSLSRAVTGTERMGERLRGLRETLRRILSGRRDFGELVTMLRTLGVAARIQSSHLGQVEGGFMTLSEHVKSLAEQVDRRFRVVVDRSERLQHEIESAMALAARSQESNRGSLSGSLGGVGARLGEMRETRAVANTVGQAVAGGSQEIGARIAQIMTSMQFQDITRQRLENVRDALRTAAEGMRRRVREADELGEAVARTRIIVGLERRQIRSASDTFSGEMNQILSHVRSVVKALEQLQQRLQSLGLEAARADGSIFLRVRRELANIVAGATRMADEGRHLAGTLESSLAVATEMVSYVGDIDAIGTDLRNLALNAVVRSTATGDRGRPLVVIAEAIQEQSDESRRLTANVITRLRDIGSSATELGGLAREVAEAAEEGRELSAGSLDPVIALLHDTDRRFHDRMVQVDAGVRELAASLSAALRELTLHVELERLVDYVSGHLQRVESETYDCAPEGAIPSRSEVLAQFEEGYAMSFQREVHEAYAARLEVEDEAGVEAVDEADGDLGDILFTETTGEILGDNVELF